MTTRDDGKSSHSTTDGAATTRLDDEFISMVGHELRSPLSAMMGWTQYLRMASPTADQVETGLEVIERNIKIQSRIIDDLLAISRLTSRRSRVVLGRVDAVEVVKDGAASASVVAEAAGVNLDVALPNASAWVSADVARLTQATSILFARAIELTPQGEAASIKARLDADSFKLTVKDGSIPSVLREDPLFQRPNVPPSLRLTFAFHVLFQFGSSIRMHNLEGSWTAFSPTQTVFAAARGTAIEVVMPLIT